MSMSITIPRNTVKVEIAIQVVLGPSHLRIAFLVSIASFRLVNVAPALVDENFFG